MRERKSIEVTLFEDYLIMAQLLGMAKEVIKEFKDLYPELIEESAFRTADTISFIRTVSFSSIDIAKASYSKNNPSSRSGGFSSGGGGSGSSGGGRRRFSLKFESKNENFFEKYII